MKKLLSLLVILISAVYPFHSDAINLKLKKEQTPMFNYNSWSSLESLPDKVDGIKQFYPVTLTETQGKNEGDTIAIVRGTINLPGMEARQVFLASLVYAVENLNPDNKEGFEEIDYDGNTFTVLLKTKQGRNDKETTYTRSLTIKAKKGGFDFETTDIDCQYREKGLIPRTLGLEKLHPDNNTRHNEVAKEFVNVNSAYINSLGEYAATRKNISSPNFDKVKKGADVCEGMNEDEVTILAGVPMNKRKSGDKERWIYSNDYIVVFTNGKVSKIVE